jgi:hypothetical protein
MLGGFVVDSGLLSGDLHSGLKNVLMPNDSCEKPIFIQTASVSSQPLPAHSEDIQPSQYTI